jgi:hypothetical protein
LWEPLLEAFGADAAPGGELLRVEGATVVVAVPSLAVAAGMRYSYIAARELPRSILQTFVPRNLGSCKLRLFSASTLVEIWSTCLRSVCRNIYIYPNQHMYFDPKSCYFSPGREK